MNSTQILNLLIAKLPNPERIEIELVYDSVPGTPEKHRVHFRWCGASIIAFCCSGERVEFNAAGASSASALAVALESLTRMVRLNRPPDYPEEFFQIRGFVDLSKKADENTPFAQKEVTRDDSPRCRWCAQGNPRVRSSVSSYLVHTTGPIGRVVCEDSRPPGVEDDRPVSILIGEAKASIQEAIPRLQIASPLRTDFDVIHRALRLAHQAITESENFVPTRRCLKCGGYLVMIRGRRPRIALEHQAEPPPHVEPSISREACPTCLVERMEAESESQKSATRATV
jgi:hypothetical protein